ncbi:MAG: chemotaxis protein CheX [Planctomycetota bacterium]|jgi:CheY-specific phosphatase CheX
MSGKQTQCEGSVIDLAAIKEYIWESTSEAFETMVFLPIEKVDGPDEGLDPALSLICTITFTGQLEGSFSMLCHAETAEQIARGMLMSEPEDPIEDAEINDAFGEVVNMTIGGIKARMADTAGDIQIFIPTVIKGQQVQPEMSASAPRAELTTKVGDKIVKEVMILKK